jgi:hypothetical protein
MSGSVRRFFKKIVSKDSQELQVEIVEPCATDISHIEVEITEEMTKRRLSRERRKKVLSPQSLSPQTPV